MTDPLVIRTPNGVRAFLNDVGRYESGSVHGNVIRKASDNTVIGGDLVVYDCTRCVHLEFECVTAEQKEHALLKMRRLREAIEHMEALLHDA